MAKEEKKEFIKLPDEPRMSTVSEPKLMILYSPHKLGKTSNLAALTLFKNENIPVAILIDIEDGSDYDDCTLLKISKDLPIGEKIKGFIDILDSLENYRSKNGKNKYEIGILDNLTVLNEWVEYYSTVKYMKSNIGKNWNRKSGTNEMILNPYDPDFRYVTEVVSENKGSVGYGKIREDLKWFVDRFCACFDKVILVSHIRDKVEESTGNKAASSELDLVGKLRSIMSRKVDALGRLVAEGDKRFITFVTDSNDAGVGSRCKHIAGQKILLSEAERKDSTNKQKITNIVFHWEDIYPSIKNYKHI